MTSPDVSTCCSSSPCTSQLGSTNELWNVNQEVQEQVSKSCNEIEVLKVVKGVHKQVHEPISVPKSAKLPKKLPCKGVCITFPEGMSQPTSYPFGIHSKHDIPWNYESIDDNFYLQAKSCQKWLSLEGGVCKNCQRPTSSPLYARIMHRIKLGAHKHIPLVYW